MNVLIVDDDPDITKLYDTALEREGFKTDTYNDPRKALSDFKPDYYDISLLDLRMPDMNGFDLYKEMKKLDSKESFLSKIFRLLVGEASNPERCRYRLK